MYPWILELHEDFFVIVHQEWECLIDLELLKSLQPDFIITQDSELFQYFGNGYASKFLHLFDISITDEGIFNFVEGEPIQKEPLKLMDQDLKCRLYDFSEECLSLIRLLGKKSEFKNSMMKNHFKMVH